MSAFWQIQRWSRIPEITLNFPEDKQKIPEDGRKIPGVCTIFSEMDANSPNKRVLALLYIQRMTK